MLFSQSLVIFLQVFFLSQGSPGDDLVHLQDSFGDWLLSENPEFASGVNDHRFDDQLDDLSMDVFDRWKNKVKYYMTQLNSIPKEGLSQTQRIDFDIFKGYLQTYLDGYKWRMYGALSPISIMDTPLDRSRYLVSKMAKSSKGDFQNFVARIQKLPEQIEQIKSRMMKAIELNRTQHRVSIESIPGMLDGMITENVEDSSLYAPFKEDLDNLTHVSHYERNTIRNDSKSAIQGYMNSLRELRTFLLDTYLKHSRQGYGLSSWQNGSEFYTACLQYRLTLPLTPTQVHQTGLKEVHRIAAKMKTIFTRLGIQGSIREAFKVLKNDSSLFLESADEMIAKYDDIIHRQINPKLNLLFKDLPNIPVVVRRMPYNGPFGRYFSPPPDGSKPGIFEVNTYHPDESPVFNFMATALHESNPGHHLQISIQKMANIPHYRKNRVNSGSFNIPTVFPFWTAFLEGWGLYAESLGEELGLYQSDVEWLGRYSQEMLRACRLVVDTGLHYFNWTRNEAIEYMSNYTASGQNEISFEVDRYISLPGQACAYKIGELKLWELRRKSERELGKLFDVKEFHSVVLRNGLMSLTTLENIVTNWIEDVQKQQKPTNGCISYLNVQFTGYFCIIFYFFVLLK